MLLFEGFTQESASGCKTNRFAANPINFSQPVHSLGFVLQPAVGFTSKVMHTGPVCPNTNINSAPELSFQYSCLFPNHFGFTLEVPFGVFQRNASFKLQPYDRPNIDFVAGSFYVGFSPKMAYYMSLGKKCLLQFEFGLKFMPFIYAASHWKPVEECEDVPNNEMIYLDVPQSAYIFPDVTASLLFLIHGNKRPQNNFVVGLCGSYSYITRMSISYDTRNSNLPDEYRSDGRIAWNSSMLGIVIGYRFLGLRP